MLYNEALQIILFEGGMFEDFKKAVKIYEQKTEKKYKNLYDAGYDMLFEKVDELLKEKANNGKQN